MAENKRRFKVPMVAVGIAAVIIVVIALVAFVNPFATPVDSYTYEYETLDRASDTVVDSGTWDYNSYDYTEIEGSDIHWSMGTDGTLTISGSGDMPDLNNFGKLAPWYQWMAESLQLDGQEEEPLYITKVVIEEGITSIGAFNFSYCSHLQSVEIASTVTSIGKCAFTGCLELTNVDLPANLTTLGRNAFSSCPALATASCPKSAEVDPGTTNITVAFDDNTEVTYY